MSDKPLDQMSAEELYALAEQRKQEEQEKTREANRKRAEELKTKKKELTNQFKKEIAAIDSEIAKLTGRTTRTRTRSGINLTDQVMEIVTKAGEISTRDIKEELDKAGISATNLSQTLAYLKRQGRVSSPQRSVYTPA